MLFTLSTSGFSYGESGANELRSLGFTMRRAEKYPADSSLAYQKDESAAPPTIEVNSLQDLLEFSRSWGEIIVDAEKMALRIYDDHEE
jgi:hypothetical protein